MAEEQQILNVKTNTVIGSTYAQIVGVIVTDNDITFEFVYKNPREEVKEAEVVARVTLPIQAAEKLPQAILDVVALHEKQKEEKRKMPDVITIGSYMPLVKNLVGTKGIVKEETEEEIFERFLFSEAFTNQVEEAERILDTNPEELIEL